MRTDSVSVVIPVQNGARWLDDVLAAVVAECAGRPFEVLVVDDGSTDGSAEIARAWAQRGVTVIAGPRRGAAAAINAGCRAARFPLIAQLDQDVIVRAGWLEILVAALSDPSVAAAQGCYTSDARAPLLARVMAHDLEQRYAAISDRTDHVCTGNVVWRRTSVEQVGGLDESLGYGYDNDLSYRLVAAGFTLVLCHQARSYHRWRESWWGYLRQQYGFGYGRLDLIARHPGRIAGDTVSPASMMAHPVLLLLALASLGGGIVVAMAGGVWWPWPSASALILGSLAFERLLAGCRAMAPSGDRAALLFPVVHLARDFAWVAAIAVWAVRRVAGVPRAPRHSMLPRPPQSSALGPAGDR